MSELEVPGSRGGRSLGRRLAAVLVVAGAITVVVALLLLGGGGGPGAGTGAGDDGTASSPGATGLPPVAVVDRVVADGIAVPVARAELASELGGTVAEVPVGLGDRVSAGDPIVRLDGTALEAELEGARAAAEAADARAAQAAALVEQAREQLAVAEANLDGADAALRTARDADQGEREAVAARDAARAQVRVARTAITAAEEAARAADAESRRAAAAVAGLEAQAARLVIAAPFDGVVASLDVLPGQVVQPGQLLARVADPEAWAFVATELDESGVARVRVGAPATVTLDGIPGVEIEGTVSRAGAYGLARQGGIVYEVVVEPTGAVPDGVRWNMTATISIGTGE